MEAENQKAESGREHQRRATIFKTAEENAKHLEAKLQKSIIKSRPYFDEKAICQSQLNTQKDRIETIKRDIVKAKNFYAQTLKQLEQISNEIHMKRGNVNEEMLNGPREPGVGAELVTPHEEIAIQRKHSPLPDFNLELDKCEMRSLGSLSGTNSSAVSERDDKENLYEDLDDLKIKFKELAVRPVEGGEGETQVWESELQQTADKMDHIMLMKECAQELNQYKNELTDSA